MHSFRLLLDKSANVAGPTLPRTLKGPLNFWRTFYSFLREELCRGLILSRLAGNLLPGRACCVLLALIFLDFTVLFDTGA